MSIPSPCIFILCLYGMKINRFLETFLILCASAEASTATSKCNFLYTHFSPAGRVTVQHLQPRKIKKRTFETFFQYTLYYKIIPRTLSAHLVIFFFFLRHATRARLHQVLRDNFCYFPSFDVQVSTARSLVCLILYHVQLTTVIKQVFKAPSLFSFFFFKQNKKKQIYPLNLIL